MANNAKTGKRLLYRDQIVVSEFRSFTNVKAFRVRMPSERAKPQALTFAPSIISVFKCVSAATFSIVASPSQFLSSTSLVTHSLNGHLVRTEVGNANGSHLAYLKLTKCKPRLF